MNLRSAAAVTAVMFVWGIPAAQAQITVSLAPGNLNYQFANHTTGATITSLNITQLGAAGKVPVDVYIIQTGGTPSPSPATNSIFNQLGAEGLGVRLLYNTPVGILQVPNAGGTTAQMQTTINQNIIGNPGFDFSTKNGSTTSPPYGSSANQTTDTTQNAQLTESLVSNPVVFPGPEDPAGNVVRMLIGTFNLQGVAPGIETVQAVDPFSIGNQNLTGPNPSTAPPDGFHGEVQLDQYLAQNVGGSYANLNAATLTVTVTPEPGTLALAGLAAAGLVGWRRRRATPVTAA